MSEASAFVVQFDPVAFEIFGWAVHWYGIMYLIGFVAGWWLMRYLARTHPQWGITAQHVDDLLFYIGLGVILGGRIGYILFYDMANVLREPTWSEALLRLVSLHKGGMSFHGGLLGVLLAVWLFNRKYRLGYFIIMDCMALIAPIGLGAGRIGNFINGELWGRPAPELAWAMIFPKSGDLVPRHPTPLYEALLEGVVLFAILWWFIRKPRPVMAISGLFALFYGLFRVVVEFYRLPDAHIGYLVGDWLTMGMVLSTPLCVVGILLLYLSYNKHDMQNTKKSL
jgi:phosphatidylglycerol:prolipoprotein diacylglycerol transferase